MDEIRRFDRVAFHGTVVEYLPESLRSDAATLQSTVTDDTGLSLVVARANEILSAVPWNLPPWVDTETRYLVVLDVPEQTIPRLATILRLHKPDQRLHVSRDPGVVKRAVIALSRSVPGEGIVDAYVISDLLCVLVGDMTKREFPKKELPALSNVSQQVFERFTIDSAGSFLHWPDLDLHMGPSQMLQAVDPAYLADVEIERYAMENISQALYDMRVDRGLRQTDIEGLSDRHVRRLENEQTRLSVGAADKFARAFGQDLGEFLDELSKRVTELRAGQGEYAVAARNSAAFPYSRIWNVAATRHQMCVKLSRGRTGSADPATRPVALRVVHHPLRDRGAEKRACDDRSRPWTAPRWSATRLSPGPGNQRIASRRVAQRFVPGRVQPLDQAR